MGKPSFEIYIEGDPDQEARAWFVSKGDAEFFISHLSPERIGTQFEWKMRPSTKQKGCPGPCPESHDSR